MVFILPLIILIIFIALIADLFLRFSSVEKEYEFSYLLDSETDGFIEDSLSNLSENK